MDQESTTAAIQRYLDALGEDSPPDPVIRALLDRAVRRLHQLCDSLLHRGYPRLARPPLNLETDEMLGAVVERLLKALREARPATARQFFALACQHMRWELNDLARRLDDIEGRRGTVRRVGAPRRAATPASPWTAAAFCNCWPPRSGTGTRPGNGREAEASNPRACTRR